MDPLRLSTTQQPTTSVSWSMSETSAAWYILTVVGFFGFIIFSLMVINLFNADENEDPYAEYLGKDTKNGKSFYKTASEYVVTYENTPVLTQDRDDRKTNEDLTKNTDKRGDKTENVKTHREFTVTVTTIS